MTHECILRFVKQFDDKDWYYFYDFDGVKVRPELAAVRDSGINNWKKISPVVAKVLSEFEKPRVLDIGCNMGLYDLEMERLGATVTGVDLKIEQALFFQKYVTENKAQRCDVKFLEYDISKSNITESFDIVTMFCVIYHIPNIDKVLRSLPQHEFMIVQGNTARSRSKKRGYPKLASSEGISELLLRHGYEIEKHFLNYSKPLIVGKRK